MIARFDRGHPRPNLTHDARALMPQNRGEDALTVEPVERIGVGVADTRCHDLDEHFPGLRAFEVELNNFQWHLGFKRNSSAGLHGRNSPTGLPYPRRKIDGRQVQKCGGAMPIRYQPEGSGNDTPWQHQSRVTTLPCRTPRKSRQISVETCAGLFTPSHPSAAPSSWSGEPCRTRNHQPDNLDPNRLRERSC